MRVRSVWLAMAAASFGASILTSSGCSNSSSPPASATPATTASTAAPAPPPPSPAPPVAPMPATVPAVSEANVPAAPAEVAPPPVAEATSGETFAAARALFDSQGCNRCHSVDANAQGGFAGGPPPDGPPGPPPGGFGPGGPGRGPGGPPRGPNLAHVGGNAEHTQAWIADHIRDPKSHNPRSRMPGFADKMSAEEIDQLAEFLASLK